jgi:hypothetical protein
MSVLIAASAYAAGASDTTTPNSIQCSDWHLNRDGSWTSNSAMHMTTINGESMNLHDSTIAPHLVKIGKPPVDLWLAITNACGGGRQ